MRCLTLLWILKLSCFLQPYLTCLCYSEASLVISIAFSCTWTKLCLCAKTESKLVSQPLNFICGSLPMCSSRGRLWISWGYAHDLRMMLQLAMALLVCQITRFRRSLKCCQVQAVRPALGARSDRPAVRPAC